MEPNPPRARRRRLTVVAVAAAVALAGIGTGFALSHRSHHSTSHYVYRSVAGRGPVSTPAPTPTAPALPHQRVAAARPTSFTISGPRFTVHAQMCAMKPVFPLDPPGDQHHTVCWVTKGFGVRPASSSGTSYVLGHSWAEDPLEVLNKVSSLATKQILRAPTDHLDGVPVHPVTALDGYRITLRTRTGTLVYRVHDAYGVSKHKLGHIDSAMDPHVPNRVVVITCAERHGRDYDQNVVLDAFLESSTAR